MGLTEKAFTGEASGQGSLPFSIASSLHLDCGVRQYFGTSRHQISYGNVRMNQLCYQDDCLSLSSSLQGAQDNSTRFQALMKDKQLEINLDKSILMIMAPKRNKKRIEEEIKKFPVKYEDKDLKIKSQEKWLGDWIHTGGSSESISATLNARKGRIMNAINEAIAIIEDSRMHRMGGIQCGLDLWNVSICSSLLTNSSSWSGMEEHHVQELEDFQLLYLRRLFQVPKSTPKPSLLYDSDAVKMKYRVY